jgi:large subunit ribosomal protein L4
MGLQISILNEKGDVKVSEAVFGQVFNETLVHQLVTRYLTVARAGTKAQKTRSDVSGGGTKPWRQKGTGRARSGTTRSPLWRTGGVTFAARPRNYDQKLNKKMFRVGIRSILSELLRQDRLIIGNEVVVTTPRTKALSIQLRAISSKHTLIVVQNVDKNLALASRNIPYVQVVEAANLNPVLLVAADKVIVTPGALQQLEERLA